MRETGPCTTEKHHLLFAVRVGVDIRQGRIRRPPEVRDEELEQLLELLVVGEAFGDRSPNVLVLVVGRYTSPRLLELCHVVGQGVVECAAGRAGADVRTLATGQLALARGQELVHLDPDGLVPRQRTLDPGDTVLGSHCDHILG